MPVYSELAHSVQELSNAIYKFQKHFNDQTRQMVLQLEATKKRMEASHLQSQAHLALVDLACTGQVQGKFY